MLPQKCVRSVANSTLGSIRYCKIKLAPNKEFSFDRRTEITRAAFRSLLVWLLLLFCSLWCSWFVSFYFVYALLVEKRASRVKQLNFKKKQKILTKQGDKQTEKEWMNKKYKPKSLSTTSRIYDYFILFYVRFFYSFFFWLACVCVFLVRFFVFVLQHVNALVSSLAAFAESSKFIW